LVAQVLIRGKEEIESCGFGSIEKIAVFQAIPALLSGGPNGVSFQEGSNGKWNSLIEENEHSGRTVRRLFEAACSELDHCLDLPAIEAVEPFHDLVDAGSGGDVLEDGGKGHAGSLEHPCAAHFAGNAFNGFAL